MTNTQLRFAAIAFAPLILSSSAFGDVFGPGGGGYIPDSFLSNNIPGSGLFTSTINVESSGNILSFNSVTLIGITHTWVGDLQVYVDSPSGTRVNMFSRLGVTSQTGFGNSNDLNGNYIFVTDGVEPSGTGPVPAGTYARSTNMNPAVVQVGSSGLIQGINTNTYSNYLGESVTGVWTLTVRSFAGGDVGNIQGWQFDATIPSSSGLYIFALAGALTRRRRGLVNL